MRNWLGIIAGSLLICCAQDTRKDKPKIASNTPAFRYELEQPEVFEMPKVLNEVSGIAFRNGNADRLFAEQDEEGVVYSLKLGSNEIGKTKFHKKGDFEDIQILNDQVLVLRSDGVIFSFPFQQAGTTKSTEAIMSGELVPPGEYEGLFADPTTAKIYVLCKICGEKPRSSTNGFVFTVNKKGLFVPAGNFTINSTDITSKTGNKKIAFEPSALGKNPVTGQWFILSSVNKVLVIADANWAITSVIKLNPSLYNQPEGLAFDKAGNLYISNERGSKQAATVLKIVRR